MTSSLFSASARQSGEGKDAGSLASAGSSDSPTTATFRYTGGFSLQVEGIFNRRMYKFSRQTPELAVLAEDVAVMRGYPELVELKRVTARVSSH